MHELGIAMDIVDIVSQRAGPARVEQIILEIGKFAAVLPDALQFCFDSVIDGTPLQGAVLTIVEMPGIAHCRSCTHELRLDKPYGRCVCGNSDLDWISGHQLKIREIEVQ